MSPKRPTDPTGPSKGPAPLSSEVAAGIFVGGWKDAQRFAGTRICVREEAPDGMPEAIHLPIYDEATGRAIRPNLDKVADEIGKARAAGGPVLVFCGHGIRRSPLAVAWYLHRTEALSLDAAIERIRRVRPQVEPPRAWLGDPTSLDSP